MRRFVCWFCLISLSVAAVSAATDKQLELLEMANAAMQAKEFDKCAEHYRAIIEIGARNPLTFYNAACCCAQSDGLDQAFLYLDTAIAIGYRDVTWLQKDADLTSLHTDDRWQEIIKKCEAAAEEFFRVNNRELAWLCDEDQADRQLERWEGMDVRDARRRSRVMEMLKDGQVISASDHFNAALILQHGDDSSHYLLAHELSLKAAELDSTLSSYLWLAAAAKDRYLWHVGQPQWFGTQRKPVDGVWTIEPIDTTVITDDERRKWNVPTLSEARNLAKRMNDEVDPTDHEHK
ncbi:MAG: hypothetical protein OEV49_08205 [candidate division Zixibacteria bacterium]|nr:hypothetical protein [candidate division Zixibacteria bacterium]MDH3936311.1 hypothetical protein [candidate division Zixibacteria bacterium]MDH4032886.1 hypothetical protein [candidate division Zixibacteria bacterium]